MKRNPRPCTALILTLLLISLLPPTQGHDTTPPCILAQQQSATAIHTTDAILLSAQAQDAAALDKAYLATNETGTWQTDSPWWDPHWTHTIRLTIDHIKVSGSLTGFPLLVTLATPDFTATAQPDGDDFLFTDSANTTQYPHEIDTYDPENGSLTAWVRLPTLNATQDTTLYLYYGNPTCPSQQHPRDLWADYLMVHHFTGTAATSLQDSATGDTALAIGSPDYGTPGRIGTSIGLNTNTTGTYLYAPGIRLPDNHSYTQTAWVSFDEARSSRGTITEGNSSQGLRLQITETDQAEAIAMTTTGPSPCRSASLLGRSPSSWHALYDCVDVQTSYHELFVNGNREAISETTGAILPEADGIMIGVNTSHAAFLHGRLDELRISARALNDSWVKTEYTMMHAPSAFLQYSTTMSQRSSTIHGSPLDLQETSEPQWANFTWSSTHVAQGMTIGWRIIFQDTAGNQNATPVHSFRVLGSAPDTPSAPCGPSQAEVGISVSFLVQSIDQDGDAISYQMDYGDGSDPGWSPASASGVSQRLTHVWEQSSEYLVRVRARDSSGAISPWSSPASIAVTDADSGSLTLHAPTAVTEGAWFVVTVTSGAFPISGATVRFAEDLRTTDASGAAGFTAPLANRAQSYRIMADHPGYEEAMATVIVVRADSGTADGWIYGGIATEDGISLRNVQVSAHPGNGTVSRCVFTDEAGRYTIPVAPGDYRLAASKAGYEDLVRPGVLVLPGQAVEVNMSLSLRAGGSSGISSDGGELAEAVIDAGIAADRIVGRLDVSEDSRYAFSSYDEGFSASLLHVSSWDVSFVVSAVNASGRIFVVRLMGPGDVDGVSVVVDGVSVQQVGIGELMAVDDGSAQFGRISDVVGGQSVVYCLVSLPHFSSHVVEVRGVVQVVSMQGLLLVYLGIATCGVVCVILPIVAIERKRR